jgi:valine--pyruvate aminotransferase
MAFSRVGSKMSGLSGLREIMDDIATSTAGTNPAEWINLSIGNPAPIPEVIATWRQLTEEAVAECFADASCRYGPTRGTPELVGAVTEYFNERYGWDIGQNNIIIGPGSQMLLFIAAALYAGPGPSGTTRITLPITPDYTGYQGLCMNPGGITGVRSLRHEIGDRQFFYGFNFPALERRSDIGVILLSNPSNPTGRSMDADELESITNIAEQRRVPLLIDQAYGEPFPRIGNTLTPPTFHQNVINFFSLSKAGLPGERIGIGIGPEPYITPMVSFLANSSLHASRLAQIAIAKGLRSGALDAVVATAIHPFYASRRNLAEQLLLASIPSSIDWRFHTCPSGMFCWVWINEQWFDDLDLYRRLKQRHVFISPGRHFFVDRPGQPDEHATRCFRISVTVDADILEEGIKQIAQVLTEIQQGLQAQPVAV